MTDAGEERTETPVVAGIDVTKPSIARTYDYLLGGKDNYAVDRALGDKFINDLPGSRAIAFDNRGALTRAVREIVENTPVRQFIDLGSGLPTADNVHQVAQRYAAGLPGRLRRQRPGRAGPRPGTARREREHHRLPG